MPPRLKLSLALGLVAIVALLFYISSGVREGLLTLLIGVPSLLLGVLASRGQSTTDEGEAQPRPDTRPFEPLHEMHNGSAPAGALLEATMNGMREGVLVVNKHLRVVSANNAATSIFVRGGEAFTGQLLSALTRNPSINAAYRAAVERREDTQVKVELVDPNRRVLELRIAPLEVGDAYDAIGVWRSCCCTVRGRSPASSSRISMSASRVTRKRCDLPGRISGKSTSALAAMMLPRKADTSCPTRLRARVAGRPAGV